MFQPPKWGSIRNIEQTSITDYGCIHSSSCSSPKERKRYSADEYVVWHGFTLHKKNKFSIKDFFNKYDQIHSFLRIWSHLLKQLFMENVII